MARPRRKKAGGESSPAPTFADVRSIVYGAGAVGARVARQLASRPGAESIALIDDRLQVAEEAATSLGSIARVATIGGLRLDGRLERFSEVASHADLVVLTAPGDHVELAETALRQGLHVVSVSDDLDVVRGLLALDGLAVDQGRSLVAGAGFSPGFSCLLARHASIQLDVVDEIHVAKFGTGGPACARQHHRALRSDAIEWRNQGWGRRRGGSGRELAWFPDPVGGLDCYWGAVPDVLLMVPAFPQVVRASAKVAATRRDRSTKWLPMLRKPHPEGLVGAVRAEVRGWRGTVRDAVILGALDRPAVAAATMASVAGAWALDGRLARLGAGGVAELVEDTTGMLAELAELGMRAAVFEGMHEHR